MKTKKFKAADNAVEQLKDSASVVVDVPKQILDTAFEQIGLKPRKAPMSGEINLATGISHTNQEINRKEASLDRKIAQLQQVNKQEQEVFNAKKKTVETQIARIMEELSLEVKKLELQTAELTADVKKITVETMPANPGAYHLNFFDWVISSLRDLRSRVNESRQWLALWTQKKKQKGYWAMFKKHGTQFAMSDERAVASSAG
ncbi:MAG: DUF5660 domain-containing protein [Patescibacteria group bacterium]|nr:DUF5660 domain-containing protein [Patescibacteria group bacterium]MCL5432058.1 DUF5660 domain-containing protein [Patescibacteria group bacterium]